MKKIVYILLIGGALLLSPFQTRAKTYHLSCNGIKPGQGNTSISKAPARPLCSVTNTLASCAVKGEIPKSDRKDVASLLMNLFATILDTYPENVNDTEFIINKYIDAVQKTTEISVEEKENIYKALSVAASSYEFWNNL